MVFDPTLMCELLVGLGVVDVVGVEERSNGSLWVTVCTRSERPVCGVCGGRVWSKGDRPVGLVDLPVFGRPVRLWWRITPLDVCGSVLWCRVFCGTGSVGGAGAGLVDVSRWAVGDLLRWDTPAVQQIAIRDYEWPQRRSMWRTTVR